MTIIDHSIYDSILSNAKNYSKDTALVSGKDIITFLEVPVRVNSLLRGLLKSGFGKQRNEIDRESVKTKLVNS